MVTEFIRNRYYYPGYQLPEDIKYFNIYHWQDKQYDTYPPRKRREYDY